MKKNIKILLVLILLISMISLTACNKEKTNDNNKTNNNVETKAKDYSGVYKSDDTSELEIKKEKDTYEVNISIYRLTSFSDCTVDEIKDDILYITAKDPNKEDIKFTFDYKTKELTVTETSWNLLNIDDKFVFDK